MNNLKKIIFLSLIPAFLTIFFIVKFAMPATQEYFDLKKQIKLEKAGIKVTKSSIESLQANKTLANNLKKLDTQLLNFDVEFPAEFRDEILLIDIEMFADQAINRIVKLESMNAKRFKITTPEDEKKKKKRKRRKSKINEETHPVTIMEKPFEISTVAYYNEVIDFVSFLEDYQRKVNISSVFTEVFNDDRNKPNPRVELRIKGSVYKSKLNEHVIEKIGRKPAPKKNSRPESKGCPLKKK